MKTHNILSNYFSLIVITMNIGLSEIAFSADEKFNYSGDNGPANWAEITPAWSECSGASIEVQQSPINIQHVNSDPNLKPLSVTTYPTHINIFNNGHTIEQEYEDTGSHIFFENTEYELKQFHFHTLSEHAINKKRGAIELHAVFTEPVSKKNLVIGVIYELGHNNHFIQTLIDAGLPKKDGDITVDNALIDISNGLTNTNSYYTYDGSLTTPPCTGGVTWIVLKQTAKLSQHQWMSFRDILGNNFRPLQEFNGHTIRATTNKHHRKYSYSQPNGKHKHSTYRNNYE